ncbi:MAG TPA: class I SAM-dependent methyltransferase [Candidatus Margulisiibacteriota bacterium]|nr:class I SAM-dependent methyltransferase [Candidatus Margulisiibacteriota bacterium]
MYDYFYEIERTHWWSVSMRSVFHMLLVGALRGAGRPRMVDVGCGTGITLEEFSRHGLVFGVDAAWQAVSFSKRRNPTRGVCQANVLSLPIAAETLDVVLAFDVIEHIEDDAAALREMHRVLRPEGVAVINVPAFASLWSEKDVAAHHQRRYTRPMLNRLLQTTGFRVDRITYTNAILFPAVWCVRAIQRLAKRPWNPEGEYRPRPWVNGGLAWLLRFELSALRYFNLPCGTSVTCVARKVS